MWIFISQEPARKCAKCGGPVIGQGRMAVKLPWFPEPCYYCDCITEEEMNFLAAEYEREWKQRSSTSPEQSHSSSSGTTPTDTEPS